MNTATLLRPEHRWECEHCTLTDVTHEAQPHSRMHHCSGLAGMWTPMIPAGSKAHLVLVERGDYVGDEIVRTDANGRPWMAAQVLRDDGYDTMVYAPQARRVEGDRR